MSNRKIFLLANLLILFIIVGCRNKMKSESNTSNPKNLKAEAFTQKCLSEKAQKEKNSYKVTFIELGSVNCIPCKKMQPVMREIEKEYPDVKVLFYDV